MSGADSQGAMAAPPAVDTGRRRDQKHVWRAYIAGRSRLGLGRAKAGAGDNHNAPLWKVWSLLCPNVKDLFTKEPEMLGIGVLCACRYIELRLATSAVTALNTTLVSRSTPQFLLGLRNMTLVALLGSWLRIGYSYCQARLTWKWKRKLTHRLHDLYFKGINYYLIGEGGGSGGRKLSDADSRITEDLNTTVNGFARTFSTSVFSATAGLCYTVEILRTFGLKYALAPYAYLFVSFIAVDICMPFHKMNREIGRFRAESWGMYRFALARVDAQAESIASLKGAKFQTVNHFFMDAFMRIFGQMWPILLFPRVAVDSVEVMASVRAEIGVQALLFDSAMQAARQAMELLRELQRLVGEVERVTDLYELLEQVDRDKVSELSENILQGDSIEFQNVDIVTPKGVQLVKDLSFKVEVGSSLLLTGHNGAGKSSIFRCLAGLWKAEGTIRRPGGLASGLHQEIFYIPQRPYNVIGTLIDQLTYPDTTGGEQLNRAEVAKLLAAVDLDYLLDREDALTNNEIVWEDELSLGEKQRLAIARLVHHRPRFAILDECSTAITSEMERQLYALCKERGITFITIAHRPVLRAYHDVSLAIGDGKLGWKLETIDKGGMQEKANLMAAKSVVAADVEESIKQFSAQRSEPYASKKEVKEMPKGSTWARAMRMIRLWMNRSKTRSWPGDDGRWWSRLLFICAVLGLQLWVDDYTMRITSSIYGAVMRAGSGRRDLFRLGFTAMLCAVGKSVLWPLSLYMQWETGFDCAMKIENNLVDRYMSNNNFYKMIQIDTRIKDPEQRIAEDIFAAVFGFWSTIVFNTALPFLRLLFFSFRVGTIMGHSFSVYIAGGLGTVAYILRYFMPDYRTMYKDLSNHEGKLKKIHARVKLCSESIAFFGGGDREKQMVNERFERYMAKDWIRHWCTFKFSIIEDLFRSRIPETLQWVFRFLYGRNEFGSDSTLLQDNGESMFRGQQQLLQMTDEIFDSVGQIIALGERMAELSGRLDRVFEMQEVLDELEAEVPEECRVGDAVLTPCPPVDGKKRKGYKPWKQCVMLDENNAEGQYLPLAWPEAGGEHLTGAQGLTETELYISLEAVTLVTPRGHAIVSDLSVDIAQGKSLMVTGRNSSGKTAFVRAVAGLWPIPVGSIQAPCPAGSSRPGIKECFVVPQRIHMSIGTLQDQITYPLVIDPSERSSELEDRLMKLLKLVGIEYLVERWSGTGRIEWGGSTFGNLFGQTVQDEGGPPAWHSGWDHVCRWDDVLSIGEQQRLSIARMYYHRPKFAVLDECTSAVSIDVEEALYEASLEQDITCITISQRLTLPKFHNSELKMGENTPSGFVKRAITETENAVASAI